MCAQGIDYFENSRRAALRAAGVRDPQPACAGAATRRHLGPHRLRRPGTRCSLQHAGRRGSSSPTPRAASACTHVLDDGTIAPTAARRLDAVRAGDRDPGGRTTMHARYGAHIYGKYGFLDAFNPSFDFTTCRCATAGASRRRLGRHRLPRHRPGPDRGDDRELPQRARLERDAAQSAHAARPAARRLHGRLAQRARAQPTLSLSCGAWPLTDSSLSTKRVCQAVIDCGAGRRASPRDARDARPAASSAPAGSRAPCRASRTD